MSQLESRIRESYERLNLKPTVYLLRNAETSYDQLPDPEKVKELYKADILQIDPEYVIGIVVVGWPGLRRRPELDEAGSMFGVSPREVFTKGELNVVINERTRLAVPESERKLNRLLNSREGRFKKAVAVAMAKVILERFEEDPRDSYGRLIKR